MTDDDTRLMIERIERLTERLTFQRTYDAALVEQAMAEVTLGGSEIERAELAGVRRIMDALIKEGQRRGMHLPDERSADRRAAQCEVCHDTGLIYVPGANDEVPVPCMWCWR